MPLAAIQAGARFVVAPEPPPFLLKLQLFLGRTLLCVWQRLVLLAEVPQDVGPVEFGGVEDAVRDVAEAAAHLVLLSG